MLAAALDADEAPLLAVAWSEIEPARAVLMRLLAPLGWDGVLDRGPLGAPSSAWLEARGLSVSLAHGDGFGAACVARGGACGVDIERIDPAVDVLAVAETVLPASAARQVAVAADPCDTFFRLWTLTEAALKTLGVGFSNPTEGLDVTLDPLAVIGAAPRGAYWRAGEFAIDEDHRLAATMLASGKAEIRMIAGRLT